MIDIYSLKQEQFLSGDNFMIITFYHFCFIIYTAQE